MIQHYLKVAWRNLLRYKTQSIISIVGLAVGFTCFALATLWIRYEMTFDDFHPGADRLYMLFQTGHKENTETLYANTRYTALLAEKLEKEYPEIEASCDIMTFWSHDYQTEDHHRHTILTAGIDSSFVKMFGIRLLSGTMDFMHESTMIAITSETAARLFGKEDPVGKEIWNSGGYKALIGAVVEGWGEHSNLPYGALKSTIPAPSIRTWDYPVYYTWVRLKNGVDAEAFKDKLYRQRVKLGDTGEELTQLRLMPITHCRYEFFWEQLPIQFHYLVMFCFTGGLVILCALFNYLSLFASRLRMRIREMALRKVCGSSYSRLYALLATEFVLVLCCSCLLGLVLIELCLPAFQKLSGVQGEVYVESLFYFAGLMLLAMLAFGLVLNHFNRRVFRQSLKGSTGKRSQQYFHRSSLVLQMSIGLFLAFCVVIILKQTYFLRNKDVGMGRKNTVTMQIYSLDQAQEVADQLRRIPLVSEMLFDCHAMFPQTGSFWTDCADWEGKQPSDEAMHIKTFFCGKEQFDFYKFLLLQGEAFSGDEVDERKLIINETAAKALGWRNPVGKAIIMKDGTRIPIIGLVKDVNLSSPTVPVDPIFLDPYKYEARLARAEQVSVLMRYRTGQWQPLQTAIDSVMFQHFPNVDYKLYDAETMYDEYLKSESTLLKLLSFVSVVCVLIATFGIYSFVTLTCERRRKEIAIRKVNGAKVRDILFLFLKEYLLILVVASAIAFPIGYALMKRWIENYVEQTPISWWVYGVVFAGIACVVLLSIWTRVWKAARQNPAEAIKSE